ncbi:MAG: efflux RND transporter periplasmic adaptor subunit, partial [Bacteroidaceae bacterium]|nr:efflux RND transporter periplasmic adaptor subunit [Bacteroidaceae bacterium]
MKHLLLIALSSLLLVACGSKDDSAKGAPAGKGNGGKKGGAQRVLNVEGYVAELGQQGKNFQTMATLVPKNSVSLSAATSGRLVSLKAKDGAIVKKGTLLAKIDDSELRAQLKQAQSNKMLAEQKEQRVRGLFEKNGATKQDLESAEASLKSAQASVELIQAQLAKTEVRAPFSGKLGFVDVSVGAWLNSGTPIAELSEVDRLKAKFSLPQRYAS